MDERECPSGGYVFPAREDRKRHTDEDGGCPEKDNVRPSVAIPTKAQPTTNR